MERVANAKIRQLENRVNQLVAQLANVQSRCRLLASDLKAELNSEDTTLAEVLEIADACKTVEKVKI